ncbi:MAG TPA: flavodoxin [bacterium]|nr:flavodoxin [bacterium]HPL95751.1 flavodoxin [bacterium]
MKILIAYYSKTGKTERVAKDLAEGLNADIEKIIDQKNRQGIWGYISGGRDALKKRLTEIGPITKNPADYDLIILGMPVWGWNLTPALRTYLLENKDKIKDYAFFVTSGNTEADKMIKYFQEIMSKEAKALVGFNEKELTNQKIYQEKINDFITKIKQM